ncbi:MAG: hypothetical protein KC438_09095 [Thermomicrobiales bacterium]|nr:hypothetical protein [Thermomicrobiales bacterium]
MATNALLTTPNDGEISKAVEERLLGPARRADVVMPVLGTAPKPTERVHWQAPTGRWWLIDDFRSDPTAETYGGVVVPVDVRDRLTDLLRAGFAPDIVLVGHEMPDRFVPGDPVPDLVPGQATPSDRMPATLVNPSTDAALEAARQGSEKALALTRLAGKALVALVSAAAAAGSALGRLDPVIVAGVEVEAGVFVWVEVDRWSW